MASTAPSTADPGSFYSPKQLYQSLKSHRNILILDIREAAGEARIDTSALGNLRKPTVVAVPRAILDQSLIESALERSLPVGQERVAFQNRATADVIIILDEEGLKPEPGTPGYCLIRALTTYSKTSYKKEQPIRVLEGGYSSWSFAYPNLCSKVFKKRPSMFDDLHDVSMLEYPSLDDEEKSSVRDVPTHSGSEFSVRHSPNIRYGLPPKLTALPRPPPLSQVNGTADVPRGRKPVPVVDRAQKPRLTEPEPPQPTTAPEPSSSVQVQEPVLPSHSPPMDGSGTPPRVTTPPVNDHVRQAFKDQDENEEEMEKLEHRLRQLQDKPPPEAESKENLRESKGRGEAQTTKPLVPLIPDRGLKPGIEPPPAQLTLIPAATQPISNGNGTYQLPSIPDRQQPYIPDRQLKPQRPKTPPPDIERLVRIYRLCLERLLGQMEKSRRNELRKGVQEKGLVGLWNLGNTCFFNSVVQALLHTPPLRQLLLRPIEGREEESFVAKLRTDNELSPRSRGQLPCYFSAFFTAVWLDTSYVMGAYRLDPCTLHQAVCDATNMFGDRAQHDAQECLNLILDILAEDMNEGRPSWRAGLPSGSELDGMPMEKQEQVAWRRARSICWSPVDDIFSSQEISSTTCAVCGHQSLAFAPGKMLSLELGSESRRLSDCLRAYYRKERMEGAEWRCEKCRCPRPADKQLFLHRPPQILILHLKRFTNVARKISSPVDFDQELSVRTFLHPVMGKRGGQVSYRLYAVINHHGATMTQGHYTADVVHANRWIHIDDESFSQISASQLQPAGAYILFYARQDVQD